MCSFSYLEPVCCSMSSSNCCFLTCIQVSQEAAQVVWYSHLFQNFPQFIVIHAVKGFGIVNKAEIDVFSIYTSFVSLGKFISRYLIIFVAMVNGIDSLISLSDFSLLIYKNASDFYALILYPATLINLLINSSTFVILPLGFSMYSILPSANSESFTSFLIWIPFIYFSSLL